MVSGFVVHGSPKQAPLNQPVSHLLPPISGGEGILKNSDPQLNLVQSSTRYSQRRLPKRKNFSEPLIFSTRRFRLISLAAELQPNGTQFSESEAPAEALCHSMSNVSRGSAGTSPSRLTNVVTKSSAIGLLPTVFRERLHLAVALMQPEQFDR